MMRHSLPIEMPAAVAAASRAELGGQAVRVGYCIDTLDIGGTELNAVRTLEALDRRRFRVTVFHLHRSGPLLDRYRALGVELVHLPIGRLYAPRTAWQGLAFLRTLRRRRVQIVHTHDLYTNIFAAPWARLAGCRVIASRRWLDAAPRPGLLPLNRFSYRFAHRVISNSAHAARLLALEGVPAERVQELPNFLDEGAFGRVGDDVRSARRRSWGIPEQAFVVGTVARLVPVKNHAMLLHALARLPPEAHAVLIGEGASRAALEDLARTLRIEARVHFTGALLEPVNLHQFFDATVVCSRSEGFPNSVLEALAAGCPVVATPVGGIPEVIEDRRSGLLVPLEEPETLAERLEELRRDGELRRRLGEEGMARARLRYHQSVVIARLESLYLSLARTAGNEEALPT